MSASSSRPVWYEAWTALGPGSTEQERLVVYQAVRDSGCLPNEAGFYLVDWQIDRAIDDQTTAELRNVEERMEAIERAHGLGKYESWGHDEGPVEYHELRRQYDAAWDALHYELLDRFGGDEMAKLYRTDRDEFSRICEIGRKFFHGDADPDRFVGPAWLDELAEVIAGNMESAGPEPMGFRFSQEGDFSELTVFPTPVELVGGPDDGEHVTSSFRLDTERLRSAFEQVMDAGWISLGFGPHDVGPYVWIEGVFQGHHVYVEIRAYPPEGEEPGMKYDTNRKKHSR